MSFDNSPAPQMHTNTAPAQSRHPIDSEKRKADSRPTGGQAQARHWNLEVEARRQLRQPRIVRLRQRHDAVAGRSKRRVGPAKVRCVEYVEKLTTNLEVERLVQLELFEQREIEERMNSLPDVIHVRSNVIKCEREMLLKCWYGRCGVAGR